MPRPHKQRRISVDPPFQAYKPVGRPIGMLETVTISMDELEAMQLAHLEGYYQVAIAQRMEVSRQTAARILKSAHQKVAEALIGGKVLMLEEGPVRHSSDEVILCPKCGGSNGCNHAHHGGNHIGRFRSGGRKHK